jgi:hypothetical protein
MRLLRWLLGPAARPAGKQRAAFFAAGLVLLGASYVWTESAGVQAAVAFGLIFGVLPSLSRRHAAPSLVLAVARHVALG